MAGWCHSARRGRFGTTRRISAKQERSGRCSRYACGRSGAERTGRCSRYAHGRGWSTLRSMATLPAAACTAPGVAQRLTSDRLVIVSGLMSDREVAAARADLGRILAATPTGRNEFEGFDTHRVYALFAKTRTFD